MLLFFQRNFPVECCISNPSCYNDLFPSVLSCFQYRYCNADLCMPFSVFHICLYVNIFKIKPIQFFYNNRSRHASIGHIIIRHMKSTLLMKPIIGLNFQPMLSRLQISNNRRERCIGIIMMCNFPSIQIYRCRMTDPLTFYPDVSRCLKRFSKNPLSSVIGKKRMRLPAFRGCKQKLLTGISPGTWLKLP